MLITLVADRSDVREERALRLNGDANQKATSPRPAEFLAEIEGQLRATAASESGNSKPFQLPLVYCYLNSIEFLRDVALPVGGLAFFLGSSRQLQSLSLISCDLDSMIWRIGFRIHNANCTRS